MGKHGSPQGEDTSAPQVTPGAPRADYARGVSGSNRGRECRANNNPAARGVVSVPSRVGTDRNVCATRAFRGTDILVCVHDTTPPTSGSEPARARLLDHLVEDLE